jgi:membrane-bound ClpP family serine protease
MKNARLIIAILTSLLDEAIILGIILWGLPKLGVNLPLYGTIFIILAFAGYAIITFKLGSRILRKKPLIGLTDMVGVEGRTASRLHPKGFVRIHGELWESRSEDGDLEQSIDVIVVKQRGLQLIVRRKRNTDLPEADS